MAIKTYSGGCHCGAVRFEADLDLAGGTVRCNCSICTKARAWFAIAQPDRVRLLVGADAQTEYEWVPPGKTESGLHYRFCKTCGIRTFGRGGAGRDEVKFYFVNVAALENVDADVKLKYVDGSSDDYDREPADTRLM